MNVLDTLRIEDATPELRFVAGMLASGAQAAAWLIRCGLPYLEVVCPVTVDPDYLHVLFLNRISPRTHLMAARHSPLP